MCDRVRAWGVRRRLRCIAFVTASCLRSSFAPTLSGGTRRCTTWTYMVWATTTWVICERTRDSDQVASGASSRVRDGGRVGPFGVRRARVLDPRTQRGALRFGDRRRRETSTFRDASVRARDVRAHQTSMCRVASSARAATDDVHVTSSCSAHRMEGPRPRTRDTGGVFPRRRPAAMTRTVRTRHRRSHAHRAAYGARMTRLRAGPPARTQSRRARRRFASCCASGTTRRHVHTSCPQRMLTTSVVRRVTTQLVRRARVA